MSYDLVRGLHIIFVIAWMAGMLMMPRLLLYQTEGQRGGELESKMIAVIKRLRMIIVNPSMILTWVLGLWLLLGFRATDWSGGFGGWLVSVPVWFWPKFVLVLALSGYHGLIVGESKRMAAGEYRRSAKFWRMTNELPFVIAIVVVLLATTEPWS